MSISEWAGGQVFKLVHGHNLVYNTCWEDPRLDRQALKLTADDTVLVITSAGCNALDYALAGPKQVVAVDINPRQNALLDLKLAGIRNLQYEDFFAMFGEGRLPGATKIYQEKLRPALSEWPQRYWDRWIKFFDPENRRPFYFRGTCGTFAMLINVYINRVAKLRPYFDDLLQCATVAQQQEIYDQYLRSASGRSRCASPCAGIRSSRSWGFRRPSGTRSKRNTRAESASSFRIASRRFSPGCR